MPTVLVVEDNELNLELVTRFLKRKSYKVLEATDGMTGVAMAMNHVPDLILMDLSLPKLDGWEATRRIRALPRTAHIPIIALTAHALDKEVRRAIEAGINEFETKPVLYSRLLQKIEDLLWAAQHATATSETP